MNNADYSRVQIKDISRVDVAGLVFDIVDELHKMCSQKIDDDNVQFTVRKFVDLLNVQYRSWCWGEVKGVMHLGVTGSYGNKSERINYQTLASWMKRAQAGRSANYAEKSIYEAQQLAAQTVGNFAEISFMWKEFREWMQENSLWFVDNISERNCKSFHISRKSGTLENFKKSLVRDPDPEYLEKVKRTTLEQFKHEYEILN